MAEYACPGCRAHDMADECFHSEQNWELAGAMRDGVQRQHSTDWSPIEGAWQFADDAESVGDRVGPPPYRVEFTHPGGSYATAGLVNDRYVIAVEDGEGDVVFDYVCDLHELAPEPTDSGPV